MWKIRTADSKEFLKILKIKELRRQLKDILTAFPVDSATSLRFSPAFGGGETCFVSQTEMELLLRRPFPTDYKSSYCLYKT
ncbi:MAG: hypothetical protein E7519_02420 [Ruminococcaceae bacterium]|nr:hypothetical protein [Oscillospiraceae bacterium]